VFQGFVALSEKNQFRQNYEKMEKMFEHLVEARYEVPEVFIQVLICVERISSIS
jgi:hypothetical protein